MISPGRNRLFAGGAILGAGLLAAVAGYVRLVRYLSDVAFDRNAPKSAETAKKKIAGRSEKREFIALLDEAAKKLEESGCETVTINSSHDGTELTGHLRVCPKAKRLLIAMHGWRSSWSRDFGTVADAWLDAKCSALFVEQRGQNASGGEYMSFGVLERLDCLDWIKWATENVSSELPVYLVGVSMGATTVLLASGLDLPPNVHGIIADCGFTSPDAIWRHVMQDNLHLPYYDSLYENLCRERIGVSAKGISTTEALKNNRVPVLFAHGTDDKFVPVSMTYENYRACAAPKWLLIVPGADHGMSHYVQPERYEKTVKDFFRAYDKVTPASEVAPKTEE